MTQLAHEVLATVLQVRDNTLQVLLWQRAKDPDAGRWSLPGGTLEACRAEVDAVTVEDSVLDYVGRIAAESRKSPDLILGASPRAAVHLLRAAKAAAAIDGRDFATPDDVKSLATPTLRHRVVLKAEAEIEGLDADAVVRRVLARLDVPR